VLPTKALLPLGFHMSDADHDIDLLERIRKDDIRRAVLKAWKEND
jgi:hypothetical protein